MSRIQYHVSLHTANYTDVEFRSEFDGIPYRVVLDRANERSFHARLVEPFEETFYVELPLFVIGMTSFRFVREGMPTEELKGAILSKMEGLHRAAKLKSDLATAQSVEGGKLERMANEAMERLAAMASELEGMKRSDLDLVRQISRERSRIRRDIQKTVRSGRVSQDEGLRMLLDSKGIDAVVASTTAGLVPRWGEMKDAMGRIEAEMSKLIEVFRKETGFDLEAVERYLNSC